MSAKTKYVDSFRLLSAATSRNACCVLWVPQQVEKACCIIVSATSREKVFVLSSDWVQQSRKTCLFLMANYDTRRVTSHAFPHWRAAVSDTPINPDTVPRPWNVIWFIFSYWRGTGKRQPMLSWWNLCDRIDYNQRQTHHLICRTRNKETQGGINARRHSPTPFRLSQVKFPIVFSILMDVWSIPAVLDAGKDDTFLGKETKGCLPSSLNSISLSDWSVTSAFLPITRNASGFRCVRV